MSERLFENYIKDSDVSRELCDKYKGIVPNDLIILWQRYGFGSFMGGYMKMINPEEYQELISETYFRGSVSVPMFVTAFGDVLIWESNRYIRMIKYKDGTFEGMAAGFDFFLEDLQNEVFNKDFFEISEYNEAVKMWGDIKFEECFGYVPLLGLGGNKRVQNLKKVKIREHIEIISQLVGKIGM